MRLEEDNLLMRAWSTFKHEHQILLNKYIKEVDELFIKIVEGVVEEIPK